MTLSFIAQVKSNLDAPTSSQFGRRKIGLVVGHWPDDPGAVCLDGITEMDVNLDIAQRVMNLLQARDYQVDLLAEYDPKLYNYTASALVSLHADSCVWSANGFKVAGSKWSAVPLENQRLVECIWVEYEAETRLPRHEMGITLNMTNYHVFSEINPETPAAILEMGFISTDRRILLQEPERAAQGIVNAIECLLGPTTPSTPTPTPAP